MFLFAFQVFKMLRARGDPLFKEYPKAGVAALSMFQKAWLVLCTIQNNDLCENDVVTCEITLLPCDLCCKGEHMDEMSPTAQADPKILI